MTGAHYLAPPDFATIYDLAPLYSAGDTGKGVTIAIIGQTDIVPADITDFRAASGLSVNNPTVFTVPGTTPESVAVGAANDDLAETDLDLEWSGGVATGASIVLVNSDDVFTSLQYVDREFDQWHHRPDHQPKLRHLRGEFLQRQHRAPLSYGWSRQTARDRRSCWLPETPAQRTATTALRKPSLPQPRGWQSIIQEAVLT